MLPREQLVAQWRELSAIAGNIQKKGTPNHILVNKVLDYPWNDFISYAYYVRKEMTERGYKTMDKVWDKICGVANSYEILPIEDVYKDWHNNRYLVQCFNNLQEKYDCGGISQDDYDNIFNIVKGELDDE